MQRPRTAPRCPRIGHPTWPRASARRAAGSGAAVIAALVLATLPAGCGSSSQPARDAGDTDPVTPGAYDDALVMLGSVSAGGSHILETRVHPDGRVFYCTGRRGLTVADVSDPARPRVIGTLDASIAGSRCQHLAFSDDGRLVWFTNRGSDLSPTPFVSVFDLGQTPPRELAVFTHPSFSFEGIAVAGNLAYVAVHDAGVAVLEFAGGQLTLRGSVATGGNTWAVAVDGATVYAGDGAGGVTILDASDPSSPIVRGAVQVGGAAQSIELDPARALAYVAAGSAGFAVLDVSDPDRPGVAGALDTPGAALQVAVAGDLAYVADWNDARVIDVSVPSTPALVTTERVPGVQASFSRVMGIAARGDEVYLGEWDALYAYRMRAGVRAPDIRTASPELDFGAVAVGDTDAVAVIVTNEGQEPLVLTDATIEAAGFAIDANDALAPGAIAIAPGDSEVLELTFTPGDAGGVSTALLLFSDDPDESAYRIPVVANQPGIGPGQLAPDVQLALLEGGTFGLYDQVGTPVLLAYFATF